MELSIQELAKQVAEKAKEQITINGIPLIDFIERLNGNIENNRCNVVSCQCNKDGICQNEEKRKECVRVSGKVLCINDCEENETAENDA